MLQPRKRVTERAKSGRSRCGVCKGHIRKGEIRVGIKKWTPRYEAVTWHHESCVDAIPVRGESLAGETAIYTDEVKGIRTRFLKASRRAVSTDVRMYRKPFFEDETKPPCCPISGKTLTRETAHVHHFGRNSFVSIVDSFIEEKRIDLAQVSFSAGHFSNEQLEASFREYHRGKARFLLVHHLVNKSTLKTNPKLGPCDYCSNICELEWIFNEAVCKGCLNSEMLRTVYVTKTWAMRTYCLHDVDLERLECQPLPNPRNPGWTPMKLYRVGDIEHVAALRYGDVRSALQLRAKRNRQAEELEKRRCNNAATFHLRLRKKRKLIFIGDACSSLGGLATHAQKNYLLKLGAPPMVGLTKSRASHEIKRFRRFRGKRQGKRKRRSDGNDTNEHVALG